MFKIINIFLIITVIGCENKHKLKQPKTYPRIAVNNQIPEELKNYIDKDYIFYEKSKED